MTLTHTTRTPAPLTTTDLEYYLRYHNGERVYDYVNRTDETVHVLKFENVYDAAHFRTRLLHYVPGSFNAAAKKVELLEWTVIRSFDQSVHVRVVL